MPPTQNGGMSTTKPLQIFKPGTHTAMRGDVLSFSESDMAATAAAYDPAKHEAPLVIGHPKHDAPAYGWVKSLAVQGGALEAEPAQLDPEFAELVAQGRFKKISASFYRPDSPLNPVPGVFYLRHVGFLGAQPPAVKGLKAVEFGEADEGVVEFADWADMQNAGLWRRMRDWLIDQFGLDTADKVVPAYEVSSLEDEARRETESPQPSFSEAPAGASSAQPVQEESHAVTPEEKAALEAENAQLKQRLAEAEAVQKTAAAAQRHAAHVSFAEGLIGDGKLAPKHKDAVIAFLDFAETDTPLEFGEGDAKTTLSAAFKGFLSDMPKVIDFGEQATKDRAGNGAGSDKDSAEFAEKGADPERLVLHSKATALAKQKGISYEQAVRELL